MENYPTAQRKCFTCGKNIHHLEGCSVALSDEEEGYREKRNCVDCYNAQSGNCNESRSIKSKICIKSREKEEHL